MKRTLFTLCVGLVTIALYAENFKIDPSKRLHRHGGWGVSLCWWAGQCGRWDDEKVDRLVEWITSKEGLNYSVFRYNIPGGDDPENRHCDPHHMAKGKGLRAEMEGFLTQQGRNYDWQADAAQRRVMLKLRQTRPDAIFEAFSNTPPYFMTVSGCAAGHDNPARDNLKRECYHAFADYLIDVCLHYKKQYGLTFYSLQSLFWNQLFIPGQQSVSESSLKTFDVDLNSLTATMPVKLKQNHLSFAWNADKLNGQITSADIVYSSKANGTSKVNWKYDDFKAVGSKKFPGKQTISISTTALKNNNKGTVTMKLKNISTDSNWDVQSTISNKYKKVNAEDVLKKIMSL